MGGVEKVVERTAREVLDSRVFGVVLEIHHLTKDLARELARQHRISVFAMELVLSIVERAVYLEESPVTVSEFLEKARWLARDARVLVISFKHVATLRDVVEWIEERVKRLEELLAEAERVVAQ